MSKFDELYRLHRLLDGRRTGLPRSVLIDEHGFSRSTLAHLIAGLRDRLGAPLIHDRERGGYRYDTADGSHALPGLWFTPAELHALFTLKHLLANLAPGLLDDHLRPLQARLDKLLGSNHLGAGETAQRIRTLAAAARQKNLRHFQAIAGAVLQRHRIRIDYYNRERDETSTREISPQRLAHYRDNWYVRKRVADGRTRAADSSSGKWRRSRQGVRLRFAPRPPPGLNC